MRVSVLLVALIIVITAPTAKADGVVEINQASAIAGLLDGTPGFPVQLPAAAGSYRLTGDLTVANPGVNAIEIAAGSTTIDLNGFAIRGPQTCTDSGHGSTLICDQPNAAGSGIYVDTSGIAPSGITIRNGTVHGFAESGVRVGDESRVVDITAFENGIGIEVGSNCIVRGNLAYRNRLQGIYTGVGSVVLHNNAYRNGDHGMRIGQVAVVIGNTARDNGVTGLETLAGTTVIHDNTSATNEENGIRASAGATVLRNTVWDNGNLGLWMNSIAGYAHNVVSTGPTGTAPVSGGIEMGGNLCNGGAC